MSVTRLSSGDEQGSDHGQKEKSNSNFEVSDDEPTNDMQKEDTEDNGFQDAKNFVNSDSFNRLSVEAKKHFLFLLSWVEKKRERRRTSKKSRASRKRLASRDREDSEKAKEEEKKRIKGRALEVLMEEAKKDDGKAVKLGEKGPSYGKKNARQKTVFWFQDGLEVCGVVGSSADNNPKSIYESALDFDKKANNGPSKLEKRLVKSKDGGEAAKCGVLGCDNNSAHTGHLFVRSLKDVDSVLLYPLCDVHNGEQFDLKLISGATKWMMLKAGTGVLIKGNDDYYGQPVAIAWYKDYEKSRAAAMLTTAEESVPPKAPQRTKKVVKSPNQAAKGAPPPEKSSKSKK